MRAIAVDGAASWALFNLIQQSGVNTLNFAYTGESKEVDWSQVARDSIYKMDGWLNDLKIASPEEKRV